MPKWFFNLNYWTRDGVFAGAVVVCMFFARGGFLLVAILQPAGSRRTQPPCCYTAKGCQLRNDVGWTEVSQRCTAVFGSSALGPVPPRSESNQPEGFSERYLLHYSIYAAPILYRWSVGLGSPVVKCLKRTLESSQLSCSIVKAPLRPGRPSLVHRTW